MQEIIITNKVPLRKVSFNAGVMQENLRHGHYFSRIKQDKQSSYYDMEKDDFIEEGTITENMRFYWINNENFRNHTASDNIKYSQQYKSMQEYHSESESFTYQSRQSPTPTSPAQLAYQTAVKQFLSLTWIAFGIVAKLFFGAFAWESYFESIEEEFADFANSEYFAACAKIGGVAGATIFGVAFFLSLLEVMYNKYQDRATDVGREVVKNLIDSLKLFLAAFVIDGLWQIWADLSDKAMAESDYGVLAPMSLFILANTAIFGGLGKLMKASWATPMIVTQVAAGTLAFFANGDGALAAATRTGVGTALMALPPLLDAAKDTLDKKSEAKNEGTNKERLLKSLQK